MVRDIFVNCDWLIPVRVKCVMLGFGALKCDLFCACEA